MESNIPHLVQKNQQKSTEKPTPKKESEEFSRLSEVAKKYFGSIPALTRLAGVGEKTIYSYKYKTGIGVRTYTRLEKVGINQRYIQYGQGEVFADNESGKLLRKKFGVEKEQKPEVSLPSDEKNSILEGNLVPTNIQMVSVQYIETPLNNGQKVSLEDAYPKTIYIPNIHLHGRSPEQIAVFVNSGNTMVSSNIQHRDMLIVEKIELVEKCHGERVAFSYEGVGYAKHLFLNEGKIELFSNGQAEQSTPPLILKPDNEDFVLFGKILTVLPPAREETKLSREDFLKRL
jgi:hypothetical protein